jgi:hypothetical protein
MSFSLTPYESDVEDSNDGLTWSVLGVNPSIALVSVTADDIITVTPVSEGTDVVTLLLTDLDDDYDTLDVTINTEGGQQLPQCSDGLDNDGDGLIDMQDPGCSDPSDDDESDDPQNPQCNDGLDNDGDGLIDWPLDPGCTDPNDNDESDDPQFPQCSDGIDNDGDGLIDMQDPGCSDPNDDDESDDPQLPQCSDGIDNDGDGLIDMDDPGCSDPNDDDESDDPVLPQCNDGIDNDGDGLIDMQDPGCSDPSDNDESDDPITNQNPVAELILSRDSGAPGVIIDADGSTSYDPDGTLVSYNFVLLDQNNNVVYTDSGLGVPGMWQFHFVQEGTYTLSLTVTDNEAASDTDTEFVTISASGNTECNDGIDNDGDGLIDLDDPHCHDADDNYEGEIVIPVDPKQFSDMDDLVITRINIDGNGFMTPGEFFRVMISLENNLDEDLEDVRVEAAIFDLSARATKVLRELDSGDTENLGFVLDIPVDAMPGSYDMRIVASNDDLRRVKYRTVTIV